MKHLLKLATLAVLARAGIPASAVAQDAPSISSDSACAGMVGLVASTPREREEITAAVTALNQGATPVLTEITARSAKPRLLNGHDIARLLERNYPPDLRARGISGEVTLLMQVNESGDVGQLFVLKRSPEIEFAKAAISVVTAMRFTPPRHRGCAIPAWVLMPIVFQTDQ